MKGSEGERGIAGDKGMKGDKGENGIVGPQGMKGTRGPPGLEGERGEKGEGGDKGERGESLRVTDIEETITTLIDNKLAALNSSLWRKMEQLSEEIPPQDQEMVSGTELTEELEKPAAHLVGNGDEGHYYLGTITQWYATSGSLWSPFLQGGMKYSNGYITVPQHSLYYVYAQLSYQNISLCYQAGFSIQVNWNSRAWTFSYTQESANFHTHYMGRIISLNKGDSLSLYVTNSCYYIFSSLSSFFGAFKL
ncbi:lymphotoxin-alpha-like isoform X2 [Corticium candelabrum]|nr:lymphotoxin-alpha-like isoform X2 [Corticium candelabrum]